MKELERPRTRKINAHTQIIWKSREFSKIMKIVEQVADSKSAVLITGETGTGKEIIAEAIHYHSSRCSKPFIKINCGAIPENLLEAELFGYEKGAFTGAITQKKGKIELANNGTLFLDEIGDLSLPLQVKLLHVLQRGEFERIGGTKTIKVDVRFIAATNLNLEEKVKEKKFREDLYYRLNVLNIHLPPLRDHREDIPYLVQHFIEKFSTQNNKKIEGIEKSVLRRMLKYDWRGNVRELENMVERAVIMSNSNILKSEHFPSLYQNLSEPNNTIVIKIGMNYEEIEKEVLIKTLEYFNFNKQKTARSLNIGQATLYRKLKKYFLNQNDYEKRN